MNTSTQLTRRVQMGRARALWDAYQKHLDSHSQHDPVRLTVFDVYRWLEDEKLFPRSNDGKIASSSSHLSRRNEYPASAAPDAFCARCGLRKLHHPAPFKTEDSGLHDAQAPTTISLSLDTLTSACAAFVETVSLPPLLDIKYFVGRSAANSGPSWSPYAFSPAIFVPLSPRANTLQINSSDLVACADPNLISSIQRLVQRWDINRLRSTLDDDIPEYTTLARRTALQGSRMELCDRVAPYALLALLTRSIVKLLVHRGLGSFRQDEASTRLLERQDRPRRRAGPIPQISSTVTRRLLTPSHIFRGLAAAAQSGVLDSAALIALSRLGESVHSEVAIGMGVPELSTVSGRGTSMEVRTSIYNTPAVPKAVIKTEET